VGDAIRVLLVEDDDDNRELMAEVLEAAGFTVATAATGPDALALLSAATFDVLLTDVGMPGMGGLEVARAAKQVRPGLSIAVVTGFAERDDIARAQGREVDAVLVKPVEPEVLTAKVTELGRRAAARPAS
jgi:two-component system, OmpR family, response regulator